MYSPLAAVDQTFPVLDDPTWNSNVEPGKTKLNEHLKKRLAIRVLPISYL